MNNLEIRTKEQSIISTTYNMGVGCTFQGLNNAFFHWLSFSLPNTINIEKIISEILNLRINDFTNLGYGYQFYNKSYEHENLKIRILAEGRTKDMGTFVEFRGKACEEMQHDLKNIIKRVISNKGKINRTDIAVDDFVGFLDIDKLLYCAKESFWTGKLNNTEQRNGNSKNGKQRGKTVTFGSRQSEIFLRFYDKGIQEGVDHHWIRCEIELSGNKAQNAIELMLKGREIGELFSGVMKDHITFRIPSETDSNKRRWQVEPFWTKFLGDTEKIKLGEVAIKKRNPDIIPKQKQSGEVCMRHSDEQQ